MINLDFSYIRAKNFMPFGPEGIELDLTQYGNIILIRSENRDVADEEEKRASNGVGKCFGKGTSVLMYDGSIKLVQDIRVGDVVMGNDSTPRKVLTLSRGREKLFKVTPKKGEPYVVNQSHILALINSDKKHHKGQYKKDFYNISVSDYLQQPPSFKHLMRGYRSGVSFAHKKTTIDPYFLGLWLGDGSSCGPYITNNNNVIIKEIYKYANHLNLSVKLRNTKKKCKTYCLTKKSGHKNTLLNKLRYYNLINNKHIPFDYKTNSELVRLQLLAGLIDTDGSKAHNCYDFISKFKQLSDDVVYLARSLGFAAYVRPCRKKCQTGKVGVYWRVCISGDCNKIPVKIAYKRCHKRLINKNPLVVGISVKSIGTGDYYGFGISGNNLFLLGDFTVVHNSTIPEIIVYALYGENIKGADGSGKNKLKHDDLINNKIGKGLEAEVVWDKYKVLRQRKPNKLRFWVSPDHIWDETTEKTQGTMSETQKKIEDAIELTYETFVNIVVFRDNNASSFLECDTPTKRKIVENLLSLSPYREYFEKAKQTRNSHKEKIDLLVKEYELVLKQVDACKSRIIHIRKQETDWKEVKTNELSKLIAAIRTKKSKLEATDQGSALVEYNTAQEKIKELSTAVTGHHANLERIKVIVSELRNKLIKFQSQKDNLNSSISQHNSAINILTNKSQEKLVTINSLMSKKNTKCSECYGVVKEENFQHVTTECQKIIDENNKQLANLSPIVDAEKVELEKIKSEIAKLLKTQGVAEQKYTQVSQLISNDNHKILELHKINKPQVGIDEKIIESEINELKSQIVAKQAEIDGHSPYIEILKMAVRENEDKQQECIMAKNNIIANEQELPYYDFWVKAFGDTGIRKFVIEGILPALNARIAYWLQFLIDGKINLTFDNEFNEKIERNPSDGDPFVYHAMSGGERRRLNLAVSQAFAHIMMINSGASPSLVFLDEVTTNIDELGVENVYKMILELSKTKQVFITTHDKDLLEMLNDFENIKLVKMPRPNNFTLLEN